MINVGLEVGGCTLVQSSAPQKYDPPVSRRTVVAASGEESHNGVGCLLPELGLVLDLTALLVTSPPLLIKTRTNLNETS